MFGKSPLGRRGEGMVGQRSVRVQEERRGEVKGAKQNKILG
jgi:hypothetical protein